uniref:UBC core domain-containing protein n=1 Tax=viral metagenome TaxID=1070528 RepID=A0A6C0EYZ5_9ZZZZ
MNRVERRMRIMIEQFKTNLNEMSIEQYFQIADTKITLKQIQFNELIFNYKYKIFQLVNINNLPIEMNMKVLSYLHEYSFATYKVKIPEDYPFKPPVWSLENVKTNINWNHLFAAHFQNHRYMMSWSPSLSLEKDVLNMIEAIDKTKFVT